MEYITTKVTAKIWGITYRMVVYHCSSGRIKGSKNTWLIPVDAKKPPDGRYGGNKIKDGENK